MPDARPSGRWDEFRRTFAIAGIGLWFALGALPLVGLAAWWARGETPSPWALVQFVIPALLQTGSLVCAIRVLRDAGRSWRLSLWQAGLLLSGIAVYLAATAIALRD
jgi:hypothetical protein